jgi:hypothetical protein
MWGTFAPRPNREDKRQRLAKPFRVRCVGWLGNIAAPTIQEFRGTFRKRRMKMDTRAHICSLGEMYELVESVILRIRAMEE